MAVTQLNQVGGTYSDTSTAAANLGKFLQVIYSNGIVNQISEDFRDWEMVSKQKVTEEAAKSVNFMVQKAYGAAAVQWAKQGSGAKFPAASTSSHEEYSAGFNQLFSTVEIDYDLWKRALKTPHKYAEPLAVEIQNKGIVQKRLLSAAFHLDGSGSLGYNSTTAETAPSTNVARLTLGTGGARYFEYGDVVKPIQEDGTAFLATSSSVSYCIVIDRDRENDTVDLTGYDASDVVVTAANLNTDLQRADNALCHFYRLGQSQYVDQSADASGWGEMNGITEQMCGLPTLAAADGRVIHGATMSGVVSGTKYSCGGGAIDISHLQKGLDKLKTRNGQGADKYKQLLCSPEVNAAFIESQESDRRLININDNKRGQKGFGYIHGNDTLEIVTSEFVAPASIWSIPEGSKQSGVLELHGKEFEEVKAGSQGEFLKNDGDGYMPVIQKFMMAYMTLICKKPSSILEINSFLA